jgi:ABC-type phosphate/phosphonate transport system substrate-binding protein
LIRHALPSYDEIGAALSTTFSKLWSIFILAATDPLAGDVICVLDALDECNEQEQQRLIKALENFCLHQRTLFSASRLKFLITSRPYFEIRREFDELLKASNNIELAGNDESASIKKEIDLVIKHQVARLAQENRLVKKVTYHLEKRLLETEHRTYLWLRLLWEIIRKKLTGTIIEINELIDELPAGIQDAYETLLQRCPQPLFARKVLQIVLVAGRPLTLDEMDVALNVNKQTSSYTNLEREGSSRLQETLPSRCGLMVSIIQSKVYFIHQTVKEFLLGKAGINPSTERIWQQSLSLEESHCLMAEICLRSITFSEIQLNRANLCNALLPKNDREMEPNEYCQNYVFLSYSAIYWAEHYHDTNNSKGMKIVERLLDTSDCCSIIGRYERNCGTILHAASAGGHEKIVQILLNKKIDVNAQGGAYGTALAAASGGGHEKIVQILLNKKADVNAQDEGSYDTALTAASRGGHEKIVQILLNKKADVNAQAEDHYGTALAAAAAEGHEKIVQILLNNGAKSVEELAEAPAEAPAEALLSEAQPAERARTIITPSAATLSAPPRRRGGARGRGARGGGVRGGGARGGGRGLGQG